MTHKQALIDLRDKVAAGELTRTSAEEMAAAIFGLNQVALDVGGAYAQGSLDAALALHNAVLPGWNVTCLDQACNLAGHPWGCEVAFFDGSNPANNRKAYSRHDHNSPARAWLLAILSDLIAECDE